MAKKKTTEQEVILKYTVEQSAQVQAANEAVKKSLQDIEKAAKVGGVTGAQEFKRLTNEGKKLESEMKKIRGGFDTVGADAPDELQKVIDKVEQLNKTIRAGSAEVRDFDDEFGRSRQRVALAGDVESQLRTAGGTIGAVGGRGVEQAIGLTAEIPALIEALPLLKDSLRGLPDAAKSAASAIGPVGVGFTAAIVAAGVAFAIVANDIKRQTEVTERLLDVQEDYFEVVANGTAETARARIAEAEASNLTLQARRAELAAQVEYANQAQENAGIIVSSIIDLQGTVSTNPIEEMENDLDELNGQIIENNATIERFNQGLADNAFQTETATEALERQNVAIAEQNAMAIDMAQFRGDAIRTQQNLERMSVEQLESRNEAIQNEITALQVEQQFITENAQSTEELNATLQTYHRRLALLQIEQDSINNTVLESARVREEEEAVTRAAAEAEAELATERGRSQRELTTFVQAQLEKRIQLETRFADDLIAISEKAAEEATKALAQLENKLADLGRDLGRDLEDQQRKAQRKVLQAQIEAQREQVQDITDHTRALQDIRRKADEDETGLRQSRDFKAVANARRTARITIQDQQRDFVREQADKNKKQQQDIGDRSTEFAQEREDRLRKFAQATSDTRMQFATEQALAQQNAQATILTRRSQYQQEIVDLQQQGFQFLALRRQIANAETGFIQQTAASANQLIGFLQQQTQSFGSFGGGGNRNTTNNATTNNSVNIPVTGAPGQSNNSLANDVFNVFSRLVG